MWMLSGSQWDTRPAFVAMFNPLHYLQAIAYFARFAVAEHGWAMIVLSLVGIAALMMRAPAVAIGLAIALLSVTGFAKAYTIESDQARYVLVALWIEVIFVGAALTAAERTVTSRVAIKVLALFLAFGTLWTNRGSFLERNDPGASLFIARVIAVTGSSDAIVAPWVYVTPLGYARYVENAFSNRIPVNAGPPESMPLIRDLAMRHTTDIVLEKPLELPGFALVPLDRGFPRIYRVVKERAK
jgi:hypothetical protein